MNKEAAKLIKELGLQQHPEGGYYKETYRSHEVLNKETLPGRFKGNRNYYASIYFLMQEDDYSAFHKIQQDEVWHFYKGCAIHIHTISPNGHYKVLKLGMGVKIKENFQVCIPHGTWMAAEPVDKSSYALVGCTTAPAFEFEDFEMMDKNKAIEQFPQHKEIIERF